MNGLKLTDIEVFATEYARKRQHVVDLAETMRQEIEAVKTKHLTDLKMRVAVALEKKHILSNAIDSNKALFDKPRTHIFNGIKVGMQKQAGTIEWTDDDKVVMLIRKHFPDQVDAMLKTKTTPVLVALKQLNVAQLASISCTLEGSGDKVMIAPVDANVDKLVEAFLKDENKD